MANETTIHEQKEVLFLLYQNPTGDFPVIQWLRIHLLMQWTWVRFQIWKDPTGVLVTPSCPTLCNPMDCSPPGSLSMGFSSKNTKVGCRFLLQAVRLTVYKIDNQLERMLFTYI